MSINRVNISGNIGMEPELRQTASGASVLSFSVAVNDRRKNPQSGEWEDYTNWVSCTMFGTRAQAVAQYLGKGSKVAIEGKLRWSQWERDGQKRSKLEVVVDEIEFMSARQQHGGAQAPYQQQAGAYPPQQQYAPQTAPQQPQYAPVQATMAPQPIPQGTVEINPSIYDEDIPVGG